MSNDVFLFIITENHLDIDAKAMLDSCVNHCEFPTQEETCRNSIPEALRESNATGIFVNRVYAQLKHEDEATCHKVTGKKS